MTSGLEMVLLSGGAQFIIDRMAGKVSDEVYPKIKGHLEGDEPDIEAARRTARQHNEYEGFREAIDEFEETSGIKVEEYSLSHSDEPPQNT